MTKATRNKRYGMKRIAMGLRVPAICLLLLMLSNSVFSQGLSITGTIDATNVQVSGGIKAASLTTTGTISAAAITTSGGVIVGGNLSVTGSILATIPAANGTAMVIQGASGQAANLIEFRDNNGNVLSSINNVGAFNGPLGATALGSLGSITVTNLGATNLAATGTLSATSVFAGANLTSIGSIRTQMLDANNIITAGSLTATGNLGALNIAATGTLSATSVFAGANLTSIGSIRTQMLNANNAVVAGALTATGNLGALNIAATGTLSATSIFAGANLTSIGSIRTQMLNANNITLAGTLTTTSNLSALNIAATGSLSATTIIAGANLTTIGTLSGSRLVVPVATAGTTGFVVAGASGQTANLAEFRDNAGAVLSSFNNVGAFSGPLAATALASLGSITVTNLGATNLAATGTMSATSVFAGANLTSIGSISTQMLNANNIITGGALTATGNISAANIAATGTMSATTVVAGANLTAMGTLSGANVIVPIANAGSAGIVVVAAGSQSGNLIEFRSNTGAELSAVTSSGAFSGTMAALNVTGNIKGSSLTITNNASFGGGITATGTISAGAITTAGGVIVGGNLSAAGTITAGAITTSGGIIVGGNLSATGTITAGAITTSGGIIVGGNLSATGTITAQSLTTAGGVIVGNNLTVTGNITTKDLSVTGMFYANDLSVTGDLQMAGNLTVTGGIKSSSLSVTSEIFANAVSVTGNIGVSGTLSSTTVAFDNIAPGFVTTTAAAGTLVLTPASRYMQEITGTTTHTITLPVTAQLGKGESWLLINNSTANVTVNSSGGQVVKVLTPNSQVMVTVVNTGVTTAAAWNQSATNSFITGGGIGSLTGDITTANVEVGVISSVALAADRLLIGTTIRFVVEGQGVLTSTAKQASFRIHMGTLGTVADAVVHAFTPAAAAVGGGFFKAVFEFTIRTTGSTAVVSTGSGTLIAGAAGVSSATTVQVLNSYPPVPAFNTTTSGNILTGSVAFIGGGTGNLIIKNAYLEIVNK